MPKLTTPNLSDFESRLEYTKWTPEQHEAHRQQVLFNQACTAVETSNVCRWIWRNFRYPGLRQWLNLSQYYKTQARLDIEQEEAELDAMLDLRDTLECAV